MDALRRRNPFKYSAEYSESDDTYIMDEQGDKVKCFLGAGIDSMVAEQSEHIDDLKKLNAMSNSQNRTMLQITFALSALL